MLSASKSSSKTLTTVEARSCSTRMYLMALAPSFTNSIPGSIEPLYPPTGFPKFCIGGLHKFGRPNAEIGIQTEGPRLDSRMALAYLAAWIGASMPSRFIA